MTARLFSLAAALAAGGCDIAPEVGPPIQEACDPGDSDPSTPVSFQEDVLQGIFAKPGTGCFECHHPGAANPIGIEIGGLDLSTWENVKKGGGSAAAFPTVVPGDPCASAIVQKVKPGPPFGNRMPRNAPPFLTAIEIRTLSDWIAEGALDN